MCLTMMTGFKSLCENMGSFCVYMIIKWKWDRKLPKLNFYFIFQLYKILLIINIKAPFWCMEDKDAVSN